MNPILEKIQKTGIIPIIIIHDTKDAESLGNALVGGGIACAEITFRTDAAKESIRILKEKFPDMLVGAGTVLTTEQVDHAIEAGAEFIVSPGFNSKVVAYCKEKGIVVIPGCSNASDIEMALEYGIEVVKFFPAEQSGGLKLIKALSAPYGSIKFMATGGINESNVREYLECDKIIACGGSWMANEISIRAHEFEKIKGLTKECAEIVKEVRG